MDNNVFKGADGAYYISLKNHIRSKAFDKFACGSGISMHVWKVDAWKYLTLACLSGVLS